mgnify:CR=1 FL=1
MIPRRIAIMVTLAVMLSTASIDVLSATLDPESPEYWSDVGDATLYKGDTYSAKGYTIEFLDYETVPFEASLVHLELRRGDDVLADFILNATCNASNETIAVCDEFIWNDEVKVEIYADTEEDPRSKNPLDWPNPSIHTNLYLRKMPEISLELETNCETYTAQDSLIFLRAKIENEGDAVIKNLSVTIDPGRLRLTDGDLTRHWGSLDLDCEEEFHARLQVPSWITDPAGESFVIFANATSFDEKGMVYSKSTSTEILVLPRWGLKIRKSVNNITMEEEAWVRIDVENTGREALSIEINDTTPEHFTLCDDKNLNWRYKITPGERVRYSYFMKPTRPGIFNLPPATATFSANGETINVTSNNCTLAVDGAYIEVKKRAEPAIVTPDEDLRVIVTATNIGNKDAVIELRDQVPVSARVTRGNTTMHATLSPGSTRKISYTITLNTTGKITLEAPVVAVTGSGYSHVTTSRMPVIEVRDTAIKPTPNTLNNQSDTITTPEAEKPQRERLPAMMIYEIMLATSTLALVYLISRFR